MTITIQNEIAMFNAGTNTAMLNGTVDAYCKETRSNGQRGLGVILTCMQHAETTGDIGPLERLFRGLNGLDARRVKAISVYVFGEALVLGKKGQWRYRRNMGDSSARGVNFAALLELFDKGASFRSDVVAKKCGISTRQPAAFDMEALAKKVAAQLKKEGHTASAFEAALKEAMK